MNIDHILNYLTILIIGCFCIYLYDFLGSAKHTILKSVTRALVFRDLTYIRWHVKTKVYLACNLLLVLLICTNLLLITMFSKDNILNKPLFSFIISPLVWGVVFASFHIFLQPYKEKSS